MSERRRSRREISLDGLPTDIKAKVQKHIELHNLADNLSDVLVCAQTDSKKAKNGLFGSAKVTHQLAVLTPP